MHPINLWDVTESFFWNRTVLGSLFCLPPLAAGDVSTVVPLPEVTVLISTVSQ
jgi:hypothetical protein